MGVSMNEIKINSNTNNHAQDKNADIKDFLCMNKESL